MVCTVYYAQKQQSNHTSSLPSSSLVVGYYGLFAFFPSCTKEGITPAASSANRGIPIGTLECKYPIILLPMNLSRVATDYFKCGETVLAFAT